MSVTVRRVVMVVLAVAVVAAAVWAFLPEPVPVDVGEVSLGPLQVTVEEEGKTRIRERYVISAPLAGRLRRIALHEGDPVDEGATVVAIIEPTDPALLDARAKAEAEARVRASEAAVSRAQSRLEQASIDLDFAESEYGRVLKAFESGAATPREAEEYRVRYDTAGKALRAVEFAHDIADFELDLAQNALLHTNPSPGLADQEFRFLIHAPISGVVLRVLQESVAVITPGTPLLEVGDPSDLEVVIDVLSTDAVRIRPGATVIIDQWGGDEPLLASVRLVEPSAFTKISALGVEEQRVNVVADFVSPIEQRPTLGDGFRVEGRIVTWEGAGVVRVPSSAIFRHGDGWAVFAIEEDRARRRAIEVGHRTGLVAEVLGGLEPGRSVVLHPGDTVRDGVRVVPRERIE